MTSMTRTEKRTGMATGSGLTRRSLMAGAAAVGSFAAAGIPAWGANDKVVYATWGGSWEEAMRRAWADPFTEETGIPVVTVPGNTLGRLQAMVDSGNTEWDVIEANPELAIVGARNGLLEPIDFSVVDRSLIMDKPGMITDYSVPELQFGRLLVYSSKLENTPTTWTDLWDLDRFPGKRTFASHAIQSGFLEAALIADGVALEDLYPLDVDRAFKKLDEIREHILWQETVAQGEQYMTDGQASMGIIPDGRARNIVKHGAAVKLQPNVSILTWSVFCVPKGAPNKEAAMKFLAYVLSPKAQAAIAMEYTYGPVVPEAWKLIPPERAAILSGAPETSKAAIYLNSDWWSENLEATSELFHTWLLG